MKNMFSVLTLALVCAVLFSSCAGYKKVTTTSPDGTVTVIERGRQHKTVHRHYHGNSCGHYYYCGYWHGVPQSGGGVYISDHPHRVMGTGGGCYW